MRNIAPAIIAAAQILIGFFFFLTLIMVSQHMIAPVLMPDAHVGPTWTLFQCMIPGLLVSGVGGSLALVSSALNDFTREALDNALPSLKGEAAAVNWTARQLRNELRGVHESQG